MLTINIQNVMQPQILKMFTFSIHVILIVTLLDKKMIKVL